MVQSLTQQTPLDRPQTADAVSNQLLTIENHLRSTTLQRIQSLLFQPANRSFLVSALAPAIAVWGIMSAWDQPTIVPNEKAKRAFEKQLPVKSMSMAEATKPVDCESYLREMNVDDGNLSVRSILPCSEMRSGVLIELEIKDPGDPDFCDVALELPASVLPTYDARATVWIVIDSVSLDPSSWSLANLISTKRVDKLAEQDGRGSQFEGLSLTGNTVQLIHRELRESLCKTSALRLVVETSHFVADEVWESETRFQLRMLENPKVLSHGR